jgi:hypothetical protein
VKSEQPLKSGVIGAGITGESKILWVTSKSKEWAKREKDAEVNE